MKTEIITIGDELMSGDVTDTNFSWVGQRLWPLGFDLHWHTTVADTPQTMSEAFRAAAKRSNVVIVTGGLGPTSDDRTLAVAAETFDRQLIEDPVSLAAIQKRLEELGRPLTAEQRKQALYPEGGEMFPNREGTAPGCFLKINDTHFIFLVGVPSEMHRQWEEDVVSYLEGLQKRPLAYRYRLFRCFGAPEAELQAKLKDFAPEGVRLSFRLHFPEILIKIASSGARPDAVEKRLADAGGKIQKRLGRYVYATGENPIEKVIADLLRARGETLALAESCTGGLIANMITEVPGSSDYFKEGVVAYSNEAKGRLLGVSGKTLQEQGAVSAAVAREMAEGIRERSGTTYGIGVTGIAGPGGGTDQKPVGTVFVALATPEETTVRQHHFPFGRHYFKVMTAHAALHKLRRYLDNS